MDKMVCNKCGKELTVKNDVLMEDAVIISKTWGYFSKKDGETHKLCICEDCYDRWISDFAVPVKKEETVEYL